MKRQFPHIIVRIVFGLLVLLTAGVEPQRAEGQVKEPPIPVIIQKGQSTTPTSNAQSIVMTVADFNYLMAREDSLRRAIEQQNETLQQESRSKSFVVFALVIGLVLSNIASITIVSRRKASTAK